MWADGWPHSKKKLTCKTCDGESIVKHCPECDSWVSTFIWDAELGECHECCSLTGAKGDKL